MTFRQTETAGGESPVALLPAMGASGGVMPFWSAGALGAQRLAATGAACIQNLAACLGRHTCAEPMAPLAHEVRRLIGAFHRSVSNIRFRGTRIRPRRCIRSPSSKGGIGVSQTFAAVFATVSATIFTTKSTPIVSTTSLTPKNSTWRLTKDQPNVIGLSHCIAGGHLEYRL